MNFEEALKDSLDLYFWEPAGLTVPKIMQINWTGNNGDSVRTWKSLFFWKLRKLKLRKAEVKVNPMSSQVAIAMSRI